MTRAMYAVLTSLFLGWLVAAQHYRDPVFLVGGNPAPSTANLAPGLFIMNGNRFHTTSLFPSSLSHSQIVSATMDVDNRCIVFAAAPSGNAPKAIMNGIFRYDPATSRMTTIFKGNYRQPGPADQINGLFVNQDGDYVFGAASCAWSPTTICNHAVLKFRPGSGLTTLLLESRDFLDGASLWGATGVNISTGNYLIQVGYASYPQHHNWRNGVVELNMHHDGKWTTFSNGGGYTGYGWYQPSGRIRQDFANDALLVERTGKILRLLPGTTPLTTLFGYGMPFNWWPASPAGIPDLQSAASPRIVAPVYFNNGFASTAAFVDVDLKNRVATTHACDSSNRVGYPRGPTEIASVFEPYRARHIASVRTGTGSEWTLRFSVPEHAGKSYVAAVSVSGLRPPMRLKDGRRIWIYPDPVTAASISGALRPFFDPGPLQLDANGDAQGRLDLSRLPKLGGQPVWIALLVLDPKAPSGIALIPDTYVIRVP